MGERERERREIDNYGCVLVVHVRRCRACFSGHYTSVHSILWPHKVFQRHNKHVVLYATEY